MTAFASVWAPEDATSRPDDSDMVTVEFSVPACVGGSYADLVAEFVSWVPLPMDLRPDGSLVLAIGLEPHRRWHYRFLVDGERWVNDFDASDYVSLPDGGCMSVVMT